MQYIRFYLIQGNSSSFCNVPETLNHSIKVIFVLRAVEEEKQQHQQELLDITKSLLYLSNCAKLNVFSLSFNLRNNMMDRESQLLQIEKQRPREL